MSRAKLEVIKTSFGNASAFLVLKDEDLEKLMVSIISATTICGFEGQENEKLIALLFVIKIELRRSLKKDCFF